MKGDEIGLSSLQFEDFNNSFELKETEIFDASIKPVDKNIKQTMKELKLKRAKKRLFITKIQINQKNYFIHLQYKIILKQI